MEPPSPPQDRRDPSYPTPEELSQPGTLAEEIKSHWREHRPQLYQDLSQRGLLNQTAVLLETQVLEKLMRLVQQGTPYDAAWEVVREDAFPPDAATAPVLGVDPTTLVPPAKPD